MKMWKVDRVVWLFVPALYGVVWLFAPALYGKERERPCEG